MKQFEAGDKVILANPIAASGHGLLEGWVGYVSATDYNDQDVNVKAWNTSVEDYWWFHASELELLKTFKERDDITPQEVTGKPYSALDKQVSGNHYKDCGIQPIEYIHANNLSYLEGNVIKYTTRHSKKNKEQDVLKAIHYLELILEMEYNYSETNKDKQ